MTYSPTEVRDRHGRWVKSAAADILDHPLVRRLLSGKLNAGPSLGPRHVAGGDPFFGRIAESNGYDGRPHVVGKAAMDKLIANGATEVVRAVGPGPNGPHHFADEFRSGPLWPGHGVWGSGTYAYVKDPVRGTLDDGKLSGIHYQNGSRLRIAIPRNFRTISYEDAYKGAKTDEAAIQKLIDSGKGDVEGLKRVQEAITQNIGRWAAVRGYQGIHVAEDNLYIILDRSGVYVQASDPKGK